MDQKKQQADLRQAVQEMSRQSYHVSALLQQALESARFRRAAPPPTTSCSPRNLAGEPFAAPSPVADLLAAVK